MRQFRLLTVRLSLMLTGVLAAVAFAFDRVVAQGLLMGGLAGILSFWIIARRTEKVATQPGNRLYSVPFGWRFVELALYVLVLGRAYALDKDTFRGFIAAVAGIFIVRLVIVFLGISGMDLKQEQK